MSLRWSTSSTTLHLALGDASWNSSAIGESIGVVTGREDAVEPLRADEVLAVRPMAVR